MSEVHSFISIPDSPTETDSQMDVAMEFSSPKKTFLNKNGTLHLSKPMIRSQPCSSYLSSFETKPGLPIPVAPGSALATQQQFLNDLKQVILKALPTDKLEVYDPVILIEVSPSIQKLAELLLGLQGPTPDFVLPRHLGPEMALYLFALHKYGNSHYHLTHPCHLPCLQILLRYQNPNFNKKPISTPKKVDPNNFFIHERQLFDALALHFKDPTDFIAFFRHFPVAYFGHYLLRSMVAYTRHVRERGPQSLVILWDGDNIFMPETFLNLLDHPWLQLHVHVLVHGQQEWAFVKQLPNSSLHVSHRTFKEAVDYRILEQIKVNADVYRNQSIIIVSKDRSFEIMAQLTRDKLKTWVYRAGKINEVVFLLHWIELHVFNLNPMVPEMDVDVAM